MSILKIRVRKNDILKSIFKPIWQTVLSNILITLPNKTTQGSNISFLDSLSIFWGYYPRIFLFHEKDLFPFHSSQFQIRFCNPNMLSTFRSISSTEESPLSRNHFWKNHINTKNYIITAKSASHRNTHKIIFIF